MILVDTSVWIDFFRGHSSPEANRLTRALEAEEDLCICGLILTEILQGIQEERQIRKVRKYLDTLLYLSMPREVHVSAAKVYRAARARGLTLRNTLDCLIAACAIHHDTPLLHKDRDFVAIGKVAGLRLVDSGRS